MKLISQWHSAAITQLPAYYAVYQTYNEILHLGTRVYISMAGVAQLNLNTCIESDCA